MSAEMVRLLIELLQAEEDAIHAIEVQAAHDSELTVEQRFGILDLQSGYENLCDLLQKAIKQHE